MTTNEDTGRPARDESADEWLRKQAEEHAYYGGQGDVIERVAREYAARLGYAPAPAERPAEDGFCAKCGAPFGYRVDAPDNAPTWSCSRCGARFLAKATRCGACGGSGTDAYGTAVGVPAKCSECSGPAAAERPQEVLRCPHCGYHFEDPPIDECPECRRETGLVSERARRAVHGVEKAAYDLLAAERPHKLTCASSLCEAAPLPGALYCDEHQRHWERYLAKHLAAERPQDTPKSADEPRRSLRHLAKFFAFKAAEMSLTGIDTAKGYDAAAADVRRLLDGDAPRSAARDESGPAPGWTVGELADSTAEKRVVVSRAPGGRRCKTWEEAYAVTWALYDAEHGDAPRSEPAAGGDDDDEEDKPPEILCEDCGGPANGPGDAECVRCDCGTVVCSACCEAFDGESCCRECAAEKRKGEPAAGERGEVERLDWPEVERRAHEVIVQWSIREAVGGDDVALSEAIESLRDAMPRDAFEASAARSAALQPKGSDSNGG